MTQKDYQLIATVIAETRRDVGTWGRNAIGGYDALDRLTDELSRRLAADNPSFDPSRFELACIGKG